MSRETRLAFIGCKTVCDKVVCSRSNPHARTQSDDLFETLKASLLERINDKEPSVRVQAIVALAKLQPSPADDAEEEGDEVNETLLWILRNDSSAEVRRAALFNLSLSEANLPYILERLRDVDVINRRCVFLGSLAMLPAVAPHRASPSSSSSGTSSGGAAGAGNGLLLDPMHTNEAIGIGLKDREESVRRATKKLMATWIDACQGDLERFLERFDLLAAATARQGAAAGSSGGGAAAGTCQVSTIVAEQALSAMFEQRPALIDNVPLLSGSSSASGNKDGRTGEEVEQFWNRLTPSRALLAKCALAHLRAQAQARGAGLAGSAAAEMLEEAMPPVTALAFRIQKHFNLMLDAIERDEEARFAAGPDDDDEDEEEDVKEEEDGMDRETRRAERFTSVETRSERMIITLLLDVALQADFADEIGRRKLFGLLREIMSYAMLLSHELIGRALDLLLKLSASPKDFIRIVVEIAQGLEDDEEEQQAEEDDEDEESIVDGESNKVSHGDRA